MVQNAKKILRQGEVVNVQSDRRLQKKWIRPALIHRQKWDQNYLEMAQKGMIRGMNLKHVCQPWTPADARDEPPAEVRNYEWSAALLGKMAVVDVCEQEGDRCGPGIEWDEDVWAKIEAVSEQEWLPNRERLVGRQSSEGIRHQLMLLLGMDPATVGAAEFRRVHRAIAAFVVEHRRPPETADVEAIKKYAEEKTQALKRA